MASVGWKTKKLWDNLYISSKTENFCNLGFISEMHSESKLGTVIINMSWLKLCKAKSNMGLCPWWSNPYHQKS